MGDVSFPWNNVWRVRASPWVALFTLTNALGNFFIFIFLIGKKKYNKRSAKKHKQPKVAKKQQLYARKKRIYKHSERFTRCESSNLGPIKQGANKGGK